MYSKQILMAIALVLVSASASARSIREVLGDELHRYHPNVKVLLLNNKEIDDLDGLREVGRRYPDLRELNLKANNIKEIPGGVFLGLSNLEELDLSNNAITNMSDGVHVITSAFLRAKAEGREQLVSSFAGLTGLKVLNLGLNNLSSLPDSFGDLTGLKKLWLEWNELSSLPESFASLTALEELSLSTNELSSLPELFSSLTALKRLNLRGNNLSSLPESFGDLTALKRLWLDGNSLSSLPESFGNLKALGMLDIGWNNLRSLPESFGSLTALEELYLSRNELSSLPESFGRLTVLEELNLEWNELRSLPESFGDLIALEQLILRHNRLGEAYSGLGYEGWDPVQFFSSLVTRFMNRVTPLDKQLGGLPLTLVDLTGNKLDSQVINSVKTALPHATVRDEHLS